MPIQTLEFNNTLNTSLQEGDVVYYCPAPTGQAGRNYHNGGTNTKPKKLGTVDTIFRATRRVDVLVPVLRNTTGNYIFFSKDRVANYSGIIGYFMEVEYRNYSTAKSEIFATAVDYVDSSR